MSRDAMRGLKAKVEEEARLYRVNSIVRNIYSAAISVAKNGDMSHKSAIPRTHVMVNATPKAANPFGQAHHQGYGPDPFYLENMVDILDGLRNLFPECTISHSTLSQGTDGKFYDISTLDEKVLPFINRALDQSFIVIDWS